MSGSIRHLDTMHFDETMTAYANYIKQYENIVKDVNNATDMVINRWRGKGKNAFENDCKQVQLNLKDISDIMYDLRDALNDAHAEYIKCDLALSKSFET
ncbi:MAG: WXG100 family type VII secretion target [Acetivibrionales bacterium]|jgi:uncharacterized protein YukE